ncbi:MAG: hypothetical protein A2X09_12210 [Bacteroidetes bacterium GWF2_43_11]|nr:MAG: hypothetical protein A2X09_12210 [Bacteroidetes bacterium GWF2_43_11]
MLIGVVSLVLAISPKWLMAQTDTQFWFVAPEVSKNGAQRFDEPIYFRLSNYNMPSTVTISMPANPAFVPIVRNIPANGAATVDVSSFLETVENKPANTILNKGILITATNPITVYYEVASTYCNCNPEIYALKGRNALGTNFLIPGQTHFENSGSYSPTPYNKFDIVATQNNTTITINPMKAVVGHAAGVTFQIILNQGETWSGVATGQAVVNHLHGTEVISDKPIAITLTDDLLYGITGCADLTGDQLIAETLAGNEYIAVKGFLTNGGERIYVLGLTNNTVLTFDGGSTVANINRKEVYNYAIPNSATYLNASHPVLVLQTSGFGCELGSGVIPAIGCTGSTSVTFTRTTAQQLGLIICTRVGCESGFALNGNSTLIPASAFSAVPGTAGQWVAARITYSLAQVPMGTTCLVSNSLGLFQMGVIIGDYGDGCSYGFFSGFSSLNLGPDMALCPGDSTCLDGGEGYSSYLWNTGSTSRYLWVSSPGTYWVNVSNNFCNLSDTIAISLFPVTQVSAGSDTAICEGATVTFDAGAGFKSYRWDPPGLHTQQITVGIGGTYTVTVTDVNNCGSSDSVSLIINPLPGAIPIRHD